MTEELQTKTMLIAYNKKTQKATYAENVTSIAIKKTTWAMLNAHRQCGESFDEVIVRLFGKQIVIKGVPL